MKLKFSENLINKSNYVKENKLFFVHDVSNTNLNYERVYTRRLLLLMKDKNEEDTQKLLKKYLSLKTYIPLNEFLEKFWPT